MSRTRVRLCPDCHHRPSMREGDPCHCYCSCHDVADAAPDLVRVLAETAEWLETIAANILGVGGSHPVRERLSTQAVKIRGRAALIAMIAVTPQMAVQTAERGAS